jgi:hypothetical protein
MPRRHGSPVLAWTELPFLGRHSPVDEQKGCHCYDAAQMMR